MMSALGLALLALLTVWQGRETVYIRHLRMHELGAEARTAEIAATLTTAAHIHGLEAESLAALALLESGLNPNAKSAEGALGMLQLNPRSRWGRAWARDCKAAPVLCEARNVHWGAVALRDGLRQCGTLGMAYGFYRTGRCVEGPRAREVLRLRARLRTAVSAPPRRVTTQLIVSECGNRRAPWAGQPS